MDVFLHLVAELELDAYFAVAFLSTKVPSGLAQRMTWIEGIEISHGVVKGARAKTSVRTLTR